MGRGLGWVTPRGPCQPPTFCDSVNNPCTGRTWSNPWYATGEGSCPLPAGTNGGREDTKARDAWRHLPAAQFAAVPRSDGAAPNTGHEGSISPPQAPPAQKSFTPFSSHETSCLSSPLPGAASCCRTSRSPAQPLPHSSDPSRIKVLKFPLMSRKEIRRFRTDPVSV